MMQKNCFRPQFKKMPKQEQQMEIAAAAAPFRQEAAAARPSDWTAAQWEEYWEIWRAGCLRMLERKRRGPEAWRQLRAGWEY